MEKGKANLELENRQNSLENTEDCGHHHSHSHEESSCGHAHSHSHEESGCGCGHNHSHSHEENSCGCGHSHSHEESGCGCGHSHSHQETAKGSLEKKIYLLENLGCANCAAKMERQIGQLPGVQEATITYATKQLRLVAENPHQLLPEIQKICASIEKEVILVPLKAQSSNLTTKTYIIENLDCANCAAKIERQINQLPSVENAILTYATKQLKITAQNPDALLDEVRRIASAIEKDAIVMEKPSRPQAEERKNAGLSENKKNLLSIGTGALLFLAGNLLEEIQPTLSFFVFLAAYIILGGKVVLTAARNMTKGQVFDENFLMSIATIGAFAIKTYPEAVGVMLFYRIGEYFEERSVEKSRKQIMDAVDLRPEVVHLVTASGQVQVIDAAQAKVEDVLLVRPGDRIPLDGIVVEGESRIDTSPITGEPVPVKAAAGSQVISGCVNTSGLLKIKVEKPLSDSMVTRILDSVENAAASKPQIDRFITRFARVYTPVVVVLAALTAVVPSLITGNWSYWVYTALTFLVISCPCALVLSVPLAFFSGIGAGSKKGILFKGGVSLEAIKNVKAVVMDKTGTITKGNFVVQEVIPAGNMQPQELLALAAGCELRSTHPIGVSIVAAAREQGLEIEQPSKVEETAGQGIQALVQAGKVLCGNRKLMEAKGVALPQNQNSAFGTEVFVALNGNFAGCIIIADTIKQEAPAAIGALRSQRIVTAMLTGDAEESAQAVANATGIDEVHARLLPQDKLAELQKIRGKHGAVMFVGDGINDAPVLAGADVGAAMGSGADAAIEAADIVFMTSSMEAIPQSIAIAKATNRIAIQNVAFALVIKAMVMVLGLFGIASMWFAVFADTGVAMLCILNSIRILYKK